METTKNKLYWAYNLPLQYWPDKDGEPAQILNYMPRRQSAVMVEHDTGEQTHEEFFNTAAEYLENLAKQFRALAKNPNLTVYYHDTEVSEMD